MHQPGEPSVEEILDSIKKVIARDNREGLVAERRRRVFESRRPDESSDELIVPETADDAGVLELGVDEMVELEQETAEAGEEFVADDEQNSEALTGDSTAEAMRQNFAALAMLAQPGKQPQIVRSGETSLEGLVREMLRPMLAQWLDTNLPPMVEDLVKAEIARIAGKRG